VRLEGLDRRLAAKTFGGDPTLLETMTHHDAASNSPSMLWAFPVPPLERSPEDEGTADQAEEYWNRQAQESPANHRAQDITNRTITRIDRWEPRGNLCGKCWRTRDIGVTGLTVDLWLVSDVLSLTAKFMREASGARRRLTSAAGLLIALSATPHANSHGL
jgi:hypothetical protein